MLLVASTVYAARTPTWIYHEGKEVTTPPNIVLENAEAESLKPQWQGDAMRAAYEGNKWGVSLSRATYTLKLGQLNYYSTLSFHTQTDQNNDLTVSLSDNAKNNWVHTLALQKTESALKSVIGLDAENWAPSPQNTDQEIDFQHITQIAFSTTKGPLILDNLYLRSDVEPNANFQGSYQTESARMQIDLSADETAPTIGEIDVLPNLNGRISATPLISTVVQDSESGVASWNIEVVLASNSEVVVRKDGHGSLTTDPVEIAFQLTNALPLDSYKAKITVANSLDLVTVSRSATFVVDPFLSLSDALVGPNPYNPNSGELTIQYTLSRPADMQFYLTSISGETVWQADVLSGEPGAQEGANNAVKWSGINRYGEQIANGPYILYIIAKYGEEKKVAKVKVLVLK